MKALDGVVAGRVDVREGAALHGGAVPDRAVSELKPDIVRERVLDDQPVALFGEADDEVHAARTAAHRVGDVLDVQIDQTDPILGVLVQDDAVVAVAPRVDECVRTAAADQQVVAATARDLVVRPRTDDRVVPVRGQDGDEVRSQGRDLQPLARVGEDDPLDAIVAVVERVQRRDLIAEPTQPHDEVLPVEAAPLEARVLACVARDLQRVGAVPIADHVRAVAPSEAIRVVAVLANQQIIAA